jgi:hypothetical protein
MADDPKSGDTREPIRDLMRAEELARIFNVPVGLVLPPDPESLASLEKAVHRRNRVAHGGAVGFEPYWIDEFLELAKDILWLLDYYAGEWWALTHISEEFRRRLVGEA